MPFRREPALKPQWKAKTMNQTKDHRHALDRWENEGGASAAGGYRKLRPGLQAKPMTLPHPVVCRPEMRIAGTIHLPKLAAR